MPIIRLLQQAAFDDQTAIMLGESFDQVWDRVKASGSPLAAEDNAVLARTLLAQRIIDIAQSGERRRAVIMEQAVAYMASLRLPLRKPNSLPH
jgi:hypothetical protein